MKVSTILEYGEKSYDMDEILKKVKEDWLAKDKKVKDLIGNIYVKVEEGMIYYVVDEITYSICL